MRADEFEHKPLYIMMEPHGVKGAAVQTDREAIEYILKQVQKAIKRDKIPQAELKQMHAGLAADLTKMLPSIIRNGNAVSAHGDFVDAQTFDNDCIICAVYDHLANGNQIHITDDIGPGKSDTVHEERKYHMRAHEFVQEARPARQISQRDIDDVKYAYDQGHPYAEIADLLGMNMNDVTSILTKYYPERKRRAEHMAKALTPDDRVNITLAFADGKSIAEISDEMGIANSLVRSVITGELGDEEVQQELTRRRSTPRVQIRDKITPDMLEKIRTAYADGKSPQDISVDLDTVVSPGAIYQVLKIQPDYEQLRAKWRERRRAVKHPGPVTKTISRAGAIRPFTGNLGNYKPGRKYGRFSRSE